MKKCVYCQGKFEEDWDIDFHYICKARKRRGQPTPRIDLPEPMTDEEINIELNKSGMALDHFTFIG